MAMKRDSKIGLLVGLAFIILFGIILSEKGANPGEFTTPPSIAYKPVVELVPRTNPSLIGQPTTMSHLRADPAAGLRETRPDQPASQPAANDTAAPPRPAGNPDPSPAGNPDKPIPTPKLRMQIERGPTRQFAQVPAPEPTGEAKQPEVVRVVEHEHIAQVLEKPPVVTPRALREYEVQPKETLGDICHRFYPGQAYKMIKEVMALNNIEKAESLRAGQTVKLPEAPPVEPASTPAGQFTNAVKLVEIKTPPAPVTPEIAKAPPADKDVKWYTVQSNDTLTKIARRLYGKDNAWQALYELNKDVISDPHRIRSGIRIRLPEMASAGTPEP